MLLDIVPMGYRLPDYHVRFFLHNLLFWAPNIAATLAQTTLCNGLKNPSSQMPGFPFRNLFNDRPSSPAGTGGCYRFSNLTDKGLAFAPNNKMRVKLSGGNWTQVTIWPDGTVNTYDDPDDVCPDVETALNAAFPGKIFKIMRLDEDRTDVDFDLRDPNKDNFHWCISCLNDTFAIDPAYTDSCLPTLGWRLNTFNHGPAPATATLALHTSNMRACHSEEFFAFCVGEADSNTGQRVMPGMSPCSDILTEDPGYPHGRWLLIRDTNWGFGTCLHENYGYAGAGEPEALAYCPSTGYNLAQHNAVFFVADPTNIDRDIATGWTEGTDRFTLYHSTMGHYGDAMYFDWALHRDIAPRAHRHDTPGLYPNRYLALDIADMATRFNGTQVDSVSHKTNKWVVLKFCSPCVPAGHLFFGVPYWGPAAQFDRNCAWGLIPSNEDPSEIRETDQGSSWCTEKPLRRRIELSWLAGAPMTSEDWQYLTHQMQAPMTLNTGKRRWVPDRTAAGGKRRPFWVWDKTFQTNYSGRFGSSTFNQMDLRGMLAIMIYGRLTEFSPPAWEFLNHFTRAAMVITEEL
jgi:hypothetical protein